MTARLSSVARVGGEVACLTNTRRPIIFSDRSRRMSPEFFSMLAAQGHYKIGSAETRPQKACMCIFNEKLFKRKDIILWTRKT